MTVIFCVASDLKFERRQMLNAAWFVPGDKLLRCFFLPLQELSLFFYLHTHVGRHFYRPSLRSSRQSIHTCTAWASWCATSRRTRLWGKRWRPRSTTTSSPTSPSFTVSAKGDPSTWTVFCPWSVICAAVKQIVHLPTPSAVHCRLFKLWCHLCFVPTSVRRQNQLM